MPSVKYVIELTDSDRKALSDIVSKGQSPAKLILRANILLASDRNNKKHMTVTEIANVFNTTPTTVQNVRTSYANNGLEIHYTPKHGSWLDMAEIELSALGRQCIGKNRIPNLETLRDLLKPWYTDRNSKQRGIDWQFTTEDARVKLKRLYPIINI